MTRILLTGRTGQVGCELRRALAPLGQVIATGRETLDLADPDSIRAAIREVQPEVIVNAAGYTTVDQAEAEPDLAMQVNGVASGILAEEARTRNALLVHYSTAYVFDGTSDRPYVEDDPPNPVNVYGRTKLAGERAIAAAGCDHLILRTSWIYSNRGINFLTTILKLAREGRELAVVDDQVGSPTWARALAEATAQALACRLTRDARAGVYHLTAAGEVSRYRLTLKILEHARARSTGGDSWPGVRPIGSAGYPLPAARPPYSVLATDRIRRDLGVAMEHWEQQLERCFAEAGDETHRAQPSSRNAS